MTREASNDAEGEQKGMRKAVRARKAGVNLFTALDPSLGSNPIFCMRQETFGPNELEDCGCVYLSLYFYGFSEIPDTPVWPPTERALSQRPERCQRSSESSWLSQRLPPRWRLHQRLCRALPLALSLTKLAHRSKSDEAVLPADRRRTLFGARAPELFLRLASFARAGDLRGSYG
eukprot:6214602-Pleurochrysis_carterae.AAC.2